MAAQAVTTSRNKRDLLAVLLLVVLLLAALHMMSGAVQRAEALDRWFVPLLLFTVGGLAVLVAVIGWNLYQLLRDYRRRAAGSRLSMRLTVSFVVLVLAPVGVVYFYSLQFLASGIDSWFDVQIDSAMEDAINLSQVSLDLHKREMLRLTEGQLAGLDDFSQAGLALSLNDMREAVSATEMVLYDLQGRVLASVHQSPDVLIPSQLDSAILTQVVGGEPYVGMVALGGEAIAVRCVVRDHRQRGLVLLAEYPVAESLNRLTRNVQEAYGQYKERAYLRNSIKFSFALTLSLVMLLGVFAAVWAAVYTSRRLAQPLSDIAEATRAVAEGDYDRQLPSPRFQDELAFLVAAFNAMTRRIARARNAAETSRRELQAQHAYLETVLGGLSTGVMALGPDGTIETANAAAEHILGISLASWRECPFASLATEGEELRPFVERVEHGLVAGQQGGHVEITLHRGHGHQVLLCRYSPLVFADNSANGHVLVFDDITELLRAQRDAAWGEVARRLAHEIKNPLTPIQLSAERLRRRFLGRLPPDDVEVLDRATHTIVQQVEAMKAMVNDFSDYARPSKMQPEPLVLDRFVGEVLALYEAQSSLVHGCLEAAGVRVEADPVRLRQVIHNLVKNALEVLPDGHAEVRVHTRAMGEAGCEFVEIAVTDNGPGFDPQMLGQVFEPYVTSKAKGTGLGLAIVKRIVAEHGGSVRAENPAEGGGRVVIRLPRYLTGAAYAPGELAAV